MLAFLSGALLKIYDDFVDDEPYITNEHIATILRYLQIVFSVLLFQSDFWVSLIFTLINAACAISSFNAYSGPHVVAYFVIMPIMLFISWDKRPPINIYDVAAYISFIFYLILEPRLNPEETSWFKFFVRGICAYDCLISILIAHYFLSPSTITLFKLFMGYSIASTAAQFLKLTWLNPYPLQSSFECAWIQALGHIKPLHGEHPTCR